MSSIIGTSPPLLVDELVDERRLGEYLLRTGLSVDGASPTYVRYKPGAGAVVAMELTHGDARHLAYVRRTSDPNRAHQIVAKAHTMKPRATALGAPVRQLDERTVLFLFPTDAKLRHLRWVASGQRIRHLVMDTFTEGPYWSDESSIAILRYKPERRLVGRARLVPKRGGSRPERTFVYRLTVEADASKLAGINQAARDAGIAAPRPIATLEEGRLHLEEALDAIPLVDAVAAGWYQPAALAGIVGQIGRVAAVGLDVTSPADDVGRALHALEATRTYQPRLDGRIAELGRSLIAACPEAGPLVTSHGDLHLGQFMVGDGSIARGETIFLVDWERATVGHRGRDLGRLVAHPFALSIRRPELPIASLTSLVTDAVDEIRRQISERDFGFYLAVAFVDQALLVCRHLEPHNAERAELLLDLAARTITRATSGLRLTPPSADWNQ